MANPHPRYATTERPKRHWAKKDPSSRSQRYATDEVYRIKHLTANAMRKALRGQRENIRGLPYTATELRNHLSALFTKGMTWENYGTYWQVDHHFPLAAFDLTCPVQFQKAWALENLRPLESRKNLAKHHHLPEGLDVYLASAR